MWRTSEPFIASRWYSSANKQKVPLADLNVFLCLLNVFLWLSEMQIYHQTTTEHKAQRALDSESSSLFMHYPLQKVVSMGCVYFVLRTVQ